jgi:hypothetical protein
MEARRFLYSPYPPEADHLLLPIFDAAVSAGKSLGRPFEEREVLGQQWVERYGLMLQMDPRFYAVQAATSAQPRLWVVDAPVYLDLSYRWYRCTSTVHATKVVADMCLPTMDGPEDVIAGDYMGFDEQWRTWELRRLGGKTFLKRFTLQGPSGSEGWFLYRHTHPYRIAHVATRFTLHCGTKLAVSERAGGYVLWNGKRGEASFFTLLDAIDLQHYYQPQADGESPAEEIDSAV